MADIFSVSFGAGPSSALSARMLGNRSNAQAYMSEEVYNTYAQMRDTQQEHMVFGTTRQVEELQARINGIVDTRTISMAEDLYGLQLANDATQRWALVFPGMDMMHKLGQTEAYGRKYEPETNKLLLSRLRSGVGGMSGSDYNIQHYSDNHTLSGLNELSQYDQLVLLRNNQVALAGIDDDFDPCSTMCNCF